MSTAGQSGHRSEDHGPAATSGGSTMSRFLLPKKPVTDKKADWVFRLKVTLCTLFWFGIGILIVNRWDADLIDAPLPIREIVYPQYMPADHVDTLGAYINFTAGRSPQDMAYPKNDFVNATYPPMPYNCAPEGLNNGQKFFLYWLLPATEAFFFGIGMSFAIFVAPMIMQILPYLRWKMFMIYLGVSYYFISWVFHIEVHHMSCSVTTLIIVDFTFHFFMIAFSLFIMKYVFVLLRAASTGAAQLKTDLPWYKKSWFQVTVITIVLATPCFILGYPGLGPLAEAERDPPVVDDNNCPIGLPPPWAALCPVPDYVVCGGRCAPPPPKCPPPFLAGIPRSTIDPLCCELPPPHPCGALPTSAEEGALNFVLAFESLLFGLSMAFLWLAIPLLRQVEKKMARHRLIALVIAIWYLLASWYWHSRLHISLTKPMPFYAWALLEVAFHWSVLASSCVVAHQMYGLIRMTLEYSLSPFRSSRLSTTAKSQKKKKRSVNGDEGDSYGMVKVRDSTFQSSTYQSETSLADDEPIKVKKEKKEKEKDVEARGDAEGAEELKRKSIVTML